MPCLPRLKRARKVSQSRKTQNPKRTRIGGRVCLKLSLVVSVFFCYHYSRLPSKSRLIRAGDPVAKRLASATTPGSVQKKKKRRNGETVKQNRQNIPSVSA